MYRIEFLKEAYEEFKRLDKPVQKIIKEKLDLLASNPEALKNNIKPLVNNTYSKSRS
ncbi:type II toxin-antitoxin system RelE family toxin [Aquifex sp.]